MFTFARPYFGCASCVVFRPSATKSGQPYGVIYVLSWWTPWPRNPLTLDPPPTHPLTLRHPPPPWRDMLITSRVLHCHVTRWGGRSAFTLMKRTFLDALAKYPGHVKHDIFQTQTRKTCHIWFIGKSKRKIVCAQHIKLSRSFLFSKVWLSEQFPLQDITGRNRFREILIWIEKTASMFITVKFGGENVLFFCFVLCFVSLSFRNQLDLQFHCTLCRWKARVIQPWLQKLSSFEEHKRKV